MGVRMGRRSGKDVMSSAIDHGARAELREVRKAVDTLFTKMDALNTSMQTAVSDIQTALAALRAQTGPSLRDILSITTSGAVLFGIITGGIIYLARGGNTAAIHALDKRIYGLEITMRLTRPKAMSLMPPGSTP